MIDEMLTYILLFKDAIRLCRDEYLRHYQVKTDSWENMDESQLIAKLEELIHFGDTDFTDTHTLVDIVNFCLMILQQAYKRMYSGEIFY